MYDMCTAGLPEKRSNWPALKPLSRQLIKGFQCCYVNRLPISSGDQTDNSARVSSEAYDESRHMVTVLL